MVLAAPPTLPASLRQNVTPSRLRREYVSGGRLAWLGLNGTKTERVLPWAIDDISASFGDDIYERMLRDPQIAACIQVYKSSIIEEGASLSSPIDDPDDPNVEVARELNKAAIAMFDNLETPLDQVMDNMLDAAAFGNKVAELIWDFQRIDGDLRLNLTAIKPKPRLVTAFVVDAYMNLLGLLGQQPDKPFSPLPGTAYLPSSQYAESEILPLEKFIVVTFRPHDNDPRGTSILRPAYKPWTVKQQIYPEYIKYLAQFAGPSLIGYTAEDSEQFPTTDPLSNPDADQTQSLTPEEEMAGALEDFHNSTVAVFPYGAKVEPIQMQGDGRAFLNGFAHCDHQIVTAILTQTMATQESEHMARAAAQVHQDVLDTLIRQGKKIIIRMLQTILRRWIRYNWGEFLLPYCPVVTLGSAEQRQIPSLMASVSQLSGTGYFAPEQMPGIDRMLGLPVRDVTKIPPPLPEILPPELIPEPGPTPEPTNQKPDEKAAK